jgi:hypothetical protein
VDGLDSSEMTKLTIIGIAAAVTFIGCKSKEERGCDELERRYIAEQKGFDWRKEELPFITFDSFYSTTLNTCVITEANEMKNAFVIRDAALNFIKERPASQLFSCNEDGVNNIILEAARRLNGFVFAAPYKDYLDNMEGGPPATLQTPSAKYTAARCRSLFERRISEIR